MHTAQMAVRASSCPQKTKVESSMQDGEMKGLQNGKK
jgi:hypothetical protein